MRLLAPSTAPETTWIEEEVFGLPLRYYVAQPAPRQWVAVGLVRIGSQYRMLATSASSEARAIEQLHARLVETIARRAQSSAAVPGPLAPLP
jgi:hypothetical protein